MASSKKGCIESENGKSSGEEDREEGLSGEAGQ